MVEDTTTELPATERIADCIKKGVAPVQKCFLAPPRAPTADAAAPETGKRKTDDGDVDVSAASVSAPAVAASETVAVAAAAAAARTSTTETPAPNKSDGLDSGTGGSGGGDLVVGGAGPAKRETLPRKKLKGCNRARNHSASSALSGTTYCDLMNRTGECNYGEKCRFGHDVVAYLANKPADISDQCPLFDKFGNCPYGVKCRFAGAHVKDGRNIDSTGAFAPPDGSNRSRDEMNDIPNDIKQKLRQKRYDFPRAEGCVKALGLQWKEGYKKGGSEKNKKQQAEFLARKAQKTKEWEERRVAKEAQWAAEKAAAAGEQASCEGTEQTVAESEQVSDVAATKEEPPTNLTDAVDAATATATADTAMEDTAPTSTAAAGAVTTATPAATSDEAAIAALAQSSGGDAAEGGGIDGSGKGTRSTAERVKKTIDLRGKLILAPLTTLGNLPFRRICKGFGADVTVGEMAMVTNLLGGQSSEWSLLRRHASEDVFGVQICGTHADSTARACELISDHCSVDFVDINMGCPIDLVCNKGGGSAMLERPRRIYDLVQACRDTLDVPLTVKIRKGYRDAVNVAHQIVPKLFEYGVAAVTLHGRSKQQRYNRLADWGYIGEVREVAPNNACLIGNGDAFNWKTVLRHMRPVDADDDNVDGPDIGVASSVMIARGALIKPWLFQECKERRTWDISSSERFEMLRDFVNKGLEHWGADDYGVHTTRRFLLEWLSFLHRYIPHGLLEQNLPVDTALMNLRPPRYVARNDLEQLMASPFSQDWVKISEMLLGPAPPEFHFNPKHKSNSYDAEG